MTPSLSASVHYCMPISLAYSIIHSAYAALSLATAISACLLSRNLVLSRTTLYSPNCALSHMPKLQRQPDPELLSPSGIQIAPCMYMLGLLVITIRVPPQIRLSTEQCLINHTFTVAKHPLPLSVHNMSSSHIIHNTRSLESKDHGVQSMSLLLMADAHSCVAPANVHHSVNVADGSCPLAAARWRLWDILTVARAKQCTWDFSIRNHIRLGGGNKRLPPAQ